MFTRRFYILFLLSLGLMLFFAGCQPEATPVKLSPVEITESFYDWYLDYSWDAATETRRNPLSDGAYRDSIYLTSGLVGQVDEVLASFDKGGFDPFLMAQDVPESFTVEAFSESADEACTIVHALWSGSPSHDLTVDLVRGQDGWQINRIRQGNPLTVEGATRLFFDSYMACVRQSFADGQAEACLAAADSFVTPAFVAQVEQTKASFAQGGYDPVLLAQDVPVGIALEAPLITADRATIVVQRYWGGNPTPTPMNVHLQRVEQRWLVDGVSPLETETSARLEPGAVVDAFYGWYLAYGGNPLADGAYEQSPYLTGDLMGHVAELLTSFDKGGYDPFLCAQDRPQQISVDTVFMNDQTPLALVSSSFEDHFWTVDLRQVGDRWQISNITCAATPAGVAQAFYTWYLGNIGDRASGEFRNLMVERAYRGSPFLTDDYVVEIDELLASFADQPGGYDPFLQAQDIPWAFSVDPGVEDGTAVVHLRFGTETVHHLQVDLLEEGGRWRIMAIQPAEQPAVAAPVVAPAEPANAAPARGATALQDTTDWQTLSDEQYGFAFQYPANWVLNEFVLGAAGMPEDWPVVRSWQLMPAEMAEVILNQSGPPDPTAPVTVAPFTIDLLIGDDAAYQRVYVPSAATELLTLGGHEILVEREGSGPVRYVLSHPADETVTVVVVDWVSEFPGREAQAEVVPDMLATFLASFTFES